MESYSKMQVQHMYVRWWSESILCFLGFFFFSGWQLGEHQHIVCDVTKPQHAHDISLMIVLISSETFGNFAIQFGTNFFSRSLGGTQKRLAVEEQALSHWHGVWLDLIIARQSRGPFRWYDCLISFFILRYVTFSHDRIPAFDSHSNLAIRIINSCESFGCITRSNCIRQL